MVDDFDDWYRELRPRLATALAAWCGDADVAADAVDEAFVRACERWERVRRLDAPAGWVWRTATNVARRRLRRRGLEARSLRRHTAGSPTEVGGPRPDDLDLVDALRRLTERQRTVVVLPSWPGPRPASPARTRPRTAPRRPTDGRGQLRPAGQPPGRASTMRSAMRS